MEQSNIGNIKALREWTRRYFYTKEDINYFITKLNEGLKGYALMIIGPRNKNITISPNNYKFKLNSDGWYRGLFFFLKDQAITIEIEDGEIITYQLDEYNDTINLSPYVIATEQMTSNHFPSGYILKGRYQIFDRNSSTRSSLDARDDSWWETYEFPEPKRIYKTEIDLYTYYNYSGISFEYSLVIEGSNDNANWSPVGSKTFISAISQQTVTIYTNDPKEYIYYRISIHNGDRSNLSWYIESYISELRYYTVEQDTNNYILATPQMSSNTSDNCVCSASSSYNPPYQAFDQSINSGWYSNNTFTSDPNAWIQFKFPNNQPKIIKKLQVRLGLFTNGYPFVKSFIFMGSNDGVNFTELATCSMRHTEDLYTQIFYINNSTAYIYYRLKITEVTNINNQRFGFKEIEMYEVI